MTIKLLNNNQFQIKAGVILGYFNYLVIIAVQLVFIPVLLRCLGEDEYGVYQLAESLISYLGLFNLGFGGAYLRFYSLCKGDGKKEAELNGTYLMLFLLFALLAGIAGLMLTVFSEDIISGKFSESELYTAKILMGIMTVNMVISFPSSVFSAIISAREKFVFQKCVDIFRNISNPFLVLILLVNGFGSKSLVIVSVLLSSFCLFLNLWYVKKIIKATFSFSSFNRKLIGEVGVFSSFLFLNSIIDQVNWNVDKLILAKTSGAGAIAIYSISAQFNSFYVQISDMITSTLAPKVNRIVNRENNPLIYLNRLWIKVGRIQSRIVCAVVVGFVIFGREFVSIWAGNYYEDAYFVTLLLIVPVSIPLCQTLGVDIQRALNKHQYRTIVYAFMSIVNLLISIPLAVRFGAIGAAIGTAVSLIVGNGIVMNIIYQRIIGLKTLFFWKEILKTVPCVFIPTVSALIVKTLVNIESFLDLFIQLSLFLIVYLVTVLNLGLSNDEKEYILRLMAKYRK